MVIAPLKVDPSNVPLATPRLVFWQVPLDFQLEFASKALTMGVGAKKSSPFRPNPARVLCIFQRTRSTERQERTRVRLFSHLSRVQLGIGCSVKTPCVWCKNSVSTDAFSWTGEEESIEEGLSA